ncbi:MAG: MarC family protein [Rhodothermales bacterium]|nr:MarC family protein [Rhodothermales bacterium]
MDWSVATNFLIAMLAITNPVGKVPLWLEAAGGEGYRVRWRLAVLVVATGAGLLLLFLLLGHQILGVFGIDLASFKVGGGIIILQIGVRMLHGTAVQVEADEDDGEEDPLARAQTRFRQVIVPLSLPMIAGPGSISTALIYGTRVSTPAEYAVLSGILLGVMAVVLVTLLGSQRIERLVGPMALRLMTRLFGLILTAIAAQLILEGLGEVFPSWVEPSSPLHDDLNGGA